MSQYFNDFALAREYLQERNILIRNSPLCQTCGCQMTIIKSVSHVNDGVVYRCPMHKGYKLSVRINSILENKTS